MAITHADLAPGRWSTVLESQIGALLMVFSIICGFLCFVLCLATETARSEVTWVLSSIGGEGKKYECMNSGNGRTPLLCAGGAFLGLAIAMIVEYAYMLVTSSFKDMAAAINQRPESRVIDRSLILKSVHEVTGLDENCQDWAFDHLNRNPIEARGFIARGVEQRRRYILRNIPRS